MSKPSPDHAVNLRPKAERVAERVLRSEHKTIYLDLKRNAPHGRHRGFHIRATESAAGNKRSAIVIPVDMVAAFALALQELVRMAQEMDMGL